MRASDRAYATLLDEIQGGQLPPGSVLGEVEQAARLGVSRTPLRSAIARLTADGLVAQQSARVTVVTGVSAADIVALFEVRRALESAAVRLAAKAADPAVFGTLAAAFEAPPDDAEAYYLLVGRLDAAIDDAGRNEYLTAALRTVRTHLVRVRRLARDNPARLAVSATEHRLIAAAIAAGDAELAADATHVHLHNALRSILASLPEGHS